MPVRNRYICVECLTHREVEVANSGSSSINPMFDDEAAAVEHLEQNRTHSMTPNTIWEDEA